MILYCSLREIYCSKLKLQVNVEKIKVVLSNSNGKSFIDEFTYNENVRQSVSKYCFLSITFKCSASFN